MRAVKRVAQVLVMAALAASCVPGDSGDAHPATPMPSTSGSGKSARAEVWQWAVPLGGSAGMPALSPASPDRPEQVAFAFGHVGLVLLDAVDGKVRWQTRLVGLRDVAPLITKRLVFAATDAGVAAFGRDDGQLRWQATLWEASHRDRANTPVVAGDRLVVSSWNGTLVGLDPADGAVAWRVELPGAALAPVAAGREATVVASWDEGGQAGVTAVSTIDGRTIWEVPVASGGVSGPTVVDANAGNAADDESIAVVVAGDLSAHALSMATGRQVWVASLEGSGSPEVPPSVVGAAGTRRPDSPTAGTRSGEIVVGHRLGGIEVLAAADGARRWSASTDGAAVRGGPVSRSGDTASAAHLIDDLVVAMPLDDGRVVVAATDWQYEMRPGEGRVSGLVVTASGLLVIATRGPEPAAVLALSGWQRPLPPGPVGVARQ